jgi:hypothetical protein
MAILLQIVSLSIMLGLLWMLQPPILQHPEPVLEHQESLHHPSHQYIQGLSYEIVENDSTWILKAESAILEPAGLELINITAHHTDGRILSANRAHWCFEDKKIFFTQGVLIQDADKHIQAYAPTALYDLSVQQLIFEQSLEGQYTGI